MYCITLIYVMRGGYVLYNFDICNEGIPVYLQEQSNGITQERIVDPESITGLLSSSSTQVGEGTSLPPISDPMGT